MQRRNSRIGWTAAAGAGALAVLMGATLARAQLTPVAAANPKATGMNAPNVLSPELLESIVAQGSNPLENPTAAFQAYGYAGDGPHMPAPGDMQSTTHNVEASKTEPDKNTYLALRGLTGADPDYDYGTHFLFQGHEGGPTDGSGQKIGSLTRINLDADGEHRVTLLATTDSTGTSLQTIDGSTWYPWAQRLLFTSENGTAGGVYQATLDVPATVDALFGIFGHAGFEGIQADSDGNLMVIEDVGGSKGTVNKNARQPNSFLYRFVPMSRTDLTRGGKLQVLQVMSLAHPGQPISFHAGQADADILSQDVKDLHTYGKVFPTNWVTIHDTDVDGTAPFDANALAKAKLGTPFKRPENGQFRPGTRFREFYFDETGDTDNRTEAGSAFGGFGAVLKLTQSRTSAPTGQLSLVYLCDVTHTGFDNVAFADATHVAFVEDAGDTLHTERNAFDSAYLLDVTRDYSKPANQPVRFLALGRDASSTIDSALSAAGNGFQNEGDNEITGIHISDGDPSQFGILGAKLPTPGFAGWRVFYTQQHGDNATREIHFRSVFPGAGHDD